MSSFQPGRRRLYPKPPSRGDRRRPLGPEPPPSGDCRRPLGPEPPRSGDRRRPPGPEPPPSGDHLHSLGLEPQPSGDHRHSLGPEPPPIGGRSLPQPQRGPQLQSRPDEAGDGVDLVSGLPDEMLREVLVRLRCARSAAQTSALSRRWRDLWRQLRHLYLHFRDVTPSDLLDVLAQVPISNLALLHISFPPHKQKYYCNDACVASLLRAAASLGPVEFFFSAHVSGSSVEVPNFHRAYSISLELRNYSGYQLNIAGDFPMLERLSLSGCHFNFTDLISRCPRLRALRLGISKCLEEIRVHSTTLQELVLAVEGWCNLRLLHNDIVAPMLEVLSFTGCFLTIFMENLLMQFPYLRALRLHPTSPNRRPSIDLRMHSARIEEIVLDGVHIMWGIEIVAPALKILTVTTDHLKDIICVEAPVLKMFTLKVDEMDWNVKTFVLLPALENLLWDCTFSRPAGEIHWIWFLENLCLRMKEGIYSLSLLITLQHPGSDPPNFGEMFALPNISVLELKLYPHGHSYGATVTQILRICSEIQRVHLVVVRNRFQDKACGPKCSCDQPESWRDQDISLSAVEVVEIEGFGGKCCEVHLLKLLFRCAPLMKQVTVKQCRDMLPSIRACKEICNLFKAHPSVESNVYDSCGKKVVYERSAFASGCR